MRRFFGPDSLRSRRFARQAGVIPEEESCRIAGMSFPKGRTDAPAGCRGIFRSVCRRRAVGPHEGRVADAAVGFLEGRDVWAGFACGATEEDAGPCRKPGESVRTFAERSAASPRRTVRPPEPIKDRRGLCIIGEKGYLCVRIFGRSVRRMSCCGAFADGRSGFPDGKFCPSPKQGPIAQLVRAADS